MLHLTFGMLGVWIALSSESDWILYRLIPASGLDSTGDNARTSRKNARRSSSINYRPCQRAIPGDFDSWAMAARRWSYDEVFPYFRKSEGHRSAEVQSTRRPTAAMALGGSPYVRTILPAARDFVEARRVRGLQTRYYMDVIGRHCP